MASIFDLKNPDGSPRYRQAGTEWELHQLRVRTATLRVYREAAQAAKRDHSVIDGSLTYSEGELLRHEALLAYARLRAHCVLNQKPLPLVLR